jgi:hypothetical protein
MKDTCSNIIAIYFIYLYILYTERGVVSRAESTADSALYACLVPQLRKRRNKTFRIKCLFDRHFMRKVFCFFGAFGI